MLPLSMLSSRCIAIAGPGRVGQALARLLRERGAPVAAIAGRDPARTAAAARFAGPGVRAVTWNEVPALADRILLTVPDDALAAAAQALADAGLRAGVVLHTSGARPPDVLAPLKQAGVACGVFHPLQTVPSPERGLAALPGASYAVIGDDAAVRWALELVHRLDGQALRIRAADQPRYHAAAVLASNAIVGLIDAAVILLEEAGIEPGDALRALAPLARAATENALAAGPLAALTGPVERGDAQTVAAHLAALARTDARIHELYRAATAQLCDLSRRKHPGRDMAPLERLLRKREEA
jgi:predicted short-subunit dehydrogenase-like oxidoreductase (DUF2520 family)